MNMKMLPLSTISWRSPVIGPLYPRHVVQGDQGLSIFGVLPSDVSEVYQGISLTVQGEAWGRVASAVGTTWRQTLTTCSCCLNVTLFTHYKDIHEYCKKTDGVKPSIRPYLYLDFRIPLNYFPCKSRSNKLVLPGSANTRNVLNRVLGD